MTKVYSAVKALIKSDDKFLIIEQEFDGRRYFDLPGGKVEYGESPYETLIREVKEETSLDIEILKPLGVWWFFRAFDKGQVICNTFICKPKNTNIDLTKNPTHENIINFYWFNKEELLKLNNLLDKSLRKLFKTT